jgi:hypothetical protein
VEWAGQFISNDGSAVGKMCAEVRAEGVIYMGSAMLIAPQHQVLIEVIKRLDIAGLDLI